MPVPRRILLTPAHCGLKRAGLSPARPCHTLCCRHRLLLRKRGTVMRLLRTQLSMLMKSLMKSTLLGSDRMRHQAEVPLLQAWAGQLDRGKHAHPSLPNKQQQARLPQNHPVPSDPNTLRSKRLLPTSPSLRGLNRYHHRLTLRANSISR